MNETAKLSVSMLRFVYQHHGPSGRDTFTVYRHRYTQKLCPFYRHYPLSFVFDMILWEFVQREWKWRRRIIVLLKRKYLFDFFLSLNKINFLEIIRFTRSIWFFSELWIHEKLIFCRRNQESFFSKLGKNENLPIFSAKHLESGSVHEKNIRILLKREKERTGGRNLTNGSRP